MSKSKKKSKKATIGGAIGSLATQYMVAKKMGKKNIKNPGGAAKVVASGYVGQKLGRSIQNYITSKLKKKKNYRKADNTGLVRGYKQKSTKPSHSGGTEKSREKYTQIVNPLTGKPIIQVYRSKSKSGTKRGSVQQKQLEVKVGKKTIIDKKKKKLTGESKRMSKSFKKKKKNIFGWAEY